MLCYCTPFFQRNLSFKEFENSHGEMLTNVLAFDFRQLVHVLLNIVTIESGNISIYTGNILKRIQDPHTF